jgi:hypothetical protein
MEEKNVIDAGISTPSDSKLAYRAASRDGCPLLGLGCDPVTRR